MEEFLWVEKWRPKTIDELILPAEIKAMLQGFVDQKNIPNLLLIGPAGVGKTTVARALCEMLGCDYIIINGSLNGNIDTLRNDISKFASAVSFSGGRKYVILDEADYLTNSTQPALRNFMEEFSANCGFILTCNFKGKIIAPLQSRCSTIDFTIKKTDKEAGKLAKAFINRLYMILEIEKIEYDKPVITEIVKKHFPDWRKIINELQKYSVLGKIDSGILAQTKDLSMARLMEALKTKNLDLIQAWVIEGDYDALDAFTTLYDDAKLYFEKESIPRLILILANYQYKHAFAVNPAINLTAALLEIAIDCKIK